MAGRTPVKRPLCPSVLSAMGVLKSLPLPDRAFDPSGNWSHTYRIWTCHGYLKSGNKTQGHLRITRSAGDGGPSLAVEQSVCMDRKRDKRFHHLSARVACRRDTLCSPASWTLKSRFTGGPAGEKTPNVDCETSGKIENGRVVLRTAGGESRRDAGERITADWCLFAAVQGFDPEKEVPPFTLLEGLALLKPDQHIAADGRKPVTWGTSTVRLLRYVQIGRGVWPYEYWLDEHGRLVMVVTGPRCYILEKIGAHA